MNENIKHLLDVQRVAELKAGWAKESLNRAIEAEMEASLPKEMRILTIEVGFESPNDGLTGIFHAAVEGNFVTEGIRGYKYHDNRGSFYSKAPAWMLVFDENEYSSTWLQWRAWWSVFKDFDLT